MTVCVFNLTFVAPVLRVDLDQIVGVIIALGTLFGRIVCEQCVRRFGNERVDLHALGTVLEDEMLLARQIERIVWIAYAELIQALIAVLAFPDLLQRLSVIFE